MIIYKITNKVNGKVYIGQTIRSLKSRWSHHCTDKRGYCCLLYNAIQKYGRENFTVEQIDSAISRDELDEKEIHWIQHHDSTDKNKGYNLMSGGHHHEFSEETKRKLSESRRGRKLSEEHKRNISKANTGKRHSDETRKKLSESHKGERHHLFGKHLSDDTKLKISIGRVNFHHTEESKSKLSEAHKGKKLSKEHKEKIRQSFIGRNNHNSKRVVCVETGEVFDCIMDAVRRFDMKVNHISSCCSGKRKTSGGYHWRYESDSQRSS